jgi:hypothetical protein
MVRAITRALLRLAVLSLAAIGLVSGRVASANSGDQITQFLQMIQHDRPGVDLWHLTSCFSSADLGVLPPKEDYVDKTLRIIDRDRGNASRSVLTQALQVVPQAPDTPFQPDYCVIYTNGELQARTLRILWISSNPADLQMQYRASDGASDQCRISEATPGYVRQMLARLIWGSTKTALTDMVNKISDGPLLFDVMSINPKQTDDVFGTKRWDVLGTVSIKPTEFEKHIKVTTNILLAIDFPSPYTAIDFTPHLAVSVKVPSLASVWRAATKLLPSNVQRLITHGDNLLPASVRLAQQPDSYQYVVLMSFESRLAELYIDGKSQGFCAVSEGMPPPTGFGTQTKASAGNPVSVALDQFLNDLLVEAHKPLRPKSASSGN